MYCRNCGAFVTEGAKYCDSCGADLNGEGIRPTSTHKSSHAYLWIVALIAVAGIIFLNASPLTRGLYSYSSSISFGGAFFNQDLESLEQFFEGSYLLNEGNKYRIINIKSGLEIRESSIIEAEDGTFTYSFEFSGNYAYFTMTSTYSGEMLKVSYYRASLIERLQFLIKYI